MYRLGVDLGGTNIVAGIINDNYEILAKASTKTLSGRPMDEICEDIVKIINQACDKAGIKVSDLSSIGIGSPGSADTRNGVILVSNNLKMKNYPLSAKIESATGVKTYLANDADSAALGELVAGAGRGAKNFVAITLGTGIGSGIIINGNLVTGSFYGGGELGHTVIVKDGAQCTCGRKGCFEAYGSATALIRQTKEIMNEYPDSYMWEIVNGDINNVNGRTAFDACRKGDKAGEKVVNQYCDYLACGITNIINIFQPEVLCIGGGISNERDYLLNRLVERVNAQSFSRDSENNTVLKIAELRNDAGVVGAAALNEIN